MNKMGMHEDRQEGMFGSGGIKQLLNLFAGEYRDAVGWLSTLRSVERKRVLDALQIINGVELKVGAERVYMTTIISGSSIYPGGLPTRKTPLSTSQDTSFLWKPDRAQIARVRGHYGVINLNILFDGAVNNAGQDPTLALEHSLFDKATESTPAGVYYIKWDGGKIRVCDLRMNPAEQAYTAEHHTPLSKRVASCVRVSVIGRDRIPEGRETKESDALVFLPGYGPREFPPAEAFIYHNRGMSPPSRFLVLSRQKRLEDIAHKP